MTVAEYRELIREAWDLRNSVLSAATPEERRRECGRLARCLEEIQITECPRLREADQHRRNRVVEMCMALMQGDER